jgi:tRNA (mo5U34)-methyltransferase
METAELQAAIDSHSYWYHRIELPGGVVTPGWAPLDPAKYGVPDDLSGEAVLDVGTWDGYWAFEAARRGAAAVDAIEDFSDTCGALANADRSSAFATFDLCHQALGYGSRVVRACESIEDFSVEGQYDRVFLFGVLYHLRSPLRALDNCKRAMKPGGWIHIETAILDHTRSPHTGEPHNPQGCYAEFYPRDEFGKNHSNWWVPTLNCVCSMLEAAGFTNIEPWRLTNVPRSLAECRGFVRAKA